MNTSAEIAKPPPSATSYAARVAARRRRATLLTYRDRILPVLSVGLFLGAWQYAGTSGLVNPLFISAPTRIAEAFLLLASDGSILEHIKVSLTELLIGYGLAALVGIPIGILTGWSRTFNAAVSPFVTAGYVTPRIALVPIIILWFGIGISSKIALVFLMAVFAIVITVGAGIRDLDVHLIRVARSFGASDWQIFKTVAVPGSIPYIMAALHLALGLGLAGVVVGELYAATAGLGFLITIAGSTYQIDKMFVGVVLFIVGGLAGVGLLGALENRFSTWRPDRT